MTDPSDTIMITSIYENLIGELLIDPVRKSHEILADLEEMGWPEEPPQTQEIVLPEAAWPQQR